MSIKRCDRCNEYIDTDFNHVTRITDEIVCENCITPDEQELIDASDNVLGIDKGE